MRGVVNDHLQTIIPSNPEIPESLVSAMKYSLNAGGKRLRPILVLLAYESLGRDPREILTPACALELIHTYSLIHDDLPCMDDDDLRRGKPTLHRIFPEAIAVLAGDALHALAFELLASTGDARIVQEVGSAIGISGMLGGQVADVKSEGKSITIEEMDYIHRKKTAALIEVSLKIGAMLANADEKTINIFSGYGFKIGLAFQIVDDILDVTGDQAKLGKEIGSDEKKLKATYPRIIGLDESRKRAFELVAEAKETISAIGPESAPFLHLADFILDREH